MAKLEHAKLNPSLTVCVLSLAVRDLPYYYIGLCMKALVYIFMLSVVSVVWVLGMRILCLLKRCFLGYSMTTLNCLLIAMYSAAVVVHSGWIIQMPRPHVFLIHLHILPIFKWPPLE